MASSDKESVSSALRWVVPSEQRSSSIRWGLKPPRFAMSLVQLGIRQAVEDEVIPRLLLSHPHEDAPAPERPEWNSDRIDTLALEMANFAESGEEVSMRNLAEDLLSKGLSFEILLVHVVGAAARHLGVRWEQDTTDFLRVALAVGYLQTLMRDLCAAHQHETASTASNRRILLLPTPGETHGFGIAMVAEIFQRKGWHADCHQMHDLAEVEECVRAEWFDVVGLSLGAEKRVVRLTETIKLIRRTSRNRRVGIMVGGPQFILHPDWQTRVGADTCSGDAIHAVEQAEQLVGLLVRGRG